MENVQLQQINFIGFHSDYRNATRIYEKYVILNSCPRIG